MYICTRLRTKALLYVGCSAKCNGLVVQLVRISACHAGGRGFESRPDRKKALQWRAFSKKLCCVTHLCDQAL